MKKGVGYGAGSGSISQRYGSGDPDLDPHQYVTNPQHCIQSTSRRPIMLIIYIFFVSEASNNRTKKAGKGHDKLAEL
jgi:hypothetical protein